MYQNRPFLPTSRQMKPQHLSLLFSPPRFLLHHDLKMEYESIDSISVIWGYTYLGAWKLWSHLRDMRPIGEETLARH
jgi:hypothetical protein